MEPFTEKIAKTFADNWIASWNSHDIDNILNHYSTDFVIESRIALKLVPSSEGRVVGKQAVKNYWTLGLSKNKNLHFNLLDVLVGIDGLTIYYINTANNMRAVEMLMFNEQGQVKYAKVHHSFI